jgi:hypothetical protein
MRTTVTLDDDVYEAALSHARATGQRLGRVLSDMARQALQPEPQARRRGGRGRFATFDVPRNAGVIPASRIQQALDDDGVV